MQTLHILQRQAQLSYSNSTALRKYAISNNRPDQANAVFRIVHTNIAGFQVQLNANLYNLEQISHHWQRI